MIDNDIVNEEAFEDLAGNNGSNGGKKSNEKQRYFRRERQPLGEWWKNHILPHYHYERANIACSVNPLNLHEAMKFKDASKEGVAMQEEYNSLMTNRMCELAILPNDHRSAG